MLNESNLEEMARYKGTLRYERQQSRVELDLGFGETDAAYSLIKLNITTLAENIESNITDQPFADNLKTIGYLKAALLTLSYSLKGAKQVSLLQTIYMGIGKHIEAECWAAGLLERDERKAKLIERGVKRKHGSMRYRRQSARSMAARGGYTVENWPPALRLGVGSFLTNCLLEACPDVFELTTVQHTFKRRGKEVSETVRALGFTQWAVSHMEQLAKVMAEQFPMFLPMVEAPDEWKGLHGGGYHDPVFKRLVPMVRTKRGNKEHKALLTHAIRSGQMQPVVDSVNAIQRVPFRINERILGLLQWAKDTKQAIPGLPAPTDYEPPEYPDNWEELSDEERKRWRKKGAEINTKNVGLIGQRAVLISDLEVAHTVAQAERFWIPTNMDFRGRIYGVPHFNFQRGDYVRALFLFAEGKPLGEDGLMWLAIHLANCGDFEKVSKRSFHERLQWVNGHLDRILEVAIDPRGTVDWWKEADNPFLFVAACMEYAEALIEGPDFVSHLPVSFDGSCSGLQHLCAMTASPEGAFVNLVPTEEPQDVYQAVADRVKLRLELDAAKGNEQAKAWLRYGCGRKEVKRGVMTYCYSSRAFGMSDQILEDLMVPLADEVLKRKRKEHPFGEGEGYKEAFYMGSLLCSTIEEFIKSPAEAMGFLRKVALGLAHESKPVVWTTPLGLPVMSWYPEETTEQVRLFLHDRGIRVPVRLQVIGTPKKTIKKDKSANGVAPNFVHSMDACHLQMVVNAAQAEGITNVALVHDSFGCLAGEATRWNEIIREQFARLYTEFDVLEDVRNQALKDISVANVHRIPDVPEKGSLDMHAIMQSKYAFA